MYFQDDNESVLPIKQSLAANQSLVEKDFVVPNKNGESETGLKPAIASSTSKYSPASPLLLHKTEVYLLTNFHRLKYWSFFSNITNHVA